MPRDNSALKAELLLDENVAFKPYKDSRGFWTIGIGRNLSVTGISKDEVNFLFENDIARSISDLCREIPLFVKLDPVRQDVLINMTFNMGIEKVLEFKLMLAAIESGNYHEAANQMLRSEWHTEVGKRAARLALAMESGQYP